MKRNGLVFIALALATAPLASAPRSPLPPLPESGRLGQWGWDEAGQYGPLRAVPLEILNTEYPESWSGHSLRLVAGPASVLMRLPAVDATGQRLFNCQAGSVRFWWKPEALPAPGETATLIELGAESAGAAFGLWTWRVASAGEVIFAAQADGQEALFLRSAANLVIAGQWAEWVLAWDNQGSLLYQNGRLVARGSGVTLWPSDTVQQLFGFTLGSDLAGSASSRAVGEYEELSTYDHPLSEREVAWIYNVRARQAAPGPVSEDELLLLALRRQGVSDGGLMTLDSGPPPPPCDPCEGGGPGPPPGTNSFSSTNLHLGPPVWTNGNLLMSYGGGGTNRPPYDLFLATNIPPVPVFTNPPPMPWEWVYRTVQGQTNWTLYGVSPLQSFFLLAGTNDWDADGMTDAYERLISHTATNQAQPAFRVFITLPDNTSILP